MNLTFTAGDVESASRVLIAAATQLAERGQALWPPETLTPARLLKHYPAETWQVAWQSERPVAAYCLLPADPFFWPDDPPGEAMYLHKLGVHPDAQGQGLALTMLEHAKQLTHEAGRPFLKLDTAADRGKLRALYNDFGFVDVVEKQVGLYFVVCMELKV